MAWAFWQAAAQVLEAAGSQVDDFSLALAALDLKDRRADAADTKTELAGRFFCRMCKMNLVVLF